MDALIVSICLTTSVCALALSIVSLVYQWIKRAETPEYSAIMTIIHEVKTQHLDLLDKVEHWRRRDNVRRARQGAEEKAAAQVEPDSSQDPKAALRTLAASRGLGVVGR